jgi:hypothetical protein
MLHIDCKGSLSEPTCPLAMSRPRRIELLIAAALLCGSAFVSGFGQESIRPARAKDHLRRDVLRRRPDWHPDLLRGLPLQHSIEMSADEWPDDVRLSDIEPRFVCKACGKRGADVRSHFAWARMGTDMPILRRCRLGLRKLPRPAFCRSARLPMRRRRDALPQMQSIQRGRTAAAAERL